MTAGDIVSLAVHNENVNKKDEQDIRNRKTIFAVADFMDTL